MWIVALMGWISRPFIGRLSTLSPWDITLDSLSTPVSTCIYPFTVPLSYQFSSLSPGAMILAVSIRSNPTQTPIRLSLNILSSSSLHSWQMLFQWIPAAPIEPLHNSPHTQHVVIVIYFLRWLWTSPDTAPLARARHRDVAPSLDQMRATPY